MIRIILIAIICGIICFYLKNSNNDLFPLSLLASGIILSYYGITYLINTLEIINSLFINLNISLEFFQIVLKVLGIGLVTEYAYSILNDFDMQLLSNKIVFLGKIFIILTAFPIFSNLLEIIQNLLNL